MLVVNMVLFMYKGAQSVMNKKDLVQIGANHYRFWLNSEACSLSERSILNKVH